MANENYYRDAQNQDPRMRQSQGQSVPRQGSDGMQGRAPQNPYQRGPAGASPQNRGTAPVGRVPQGGQRPPVNGGGNMNRSGVSAGGGQMRNPYAGGQRPGAVPGRNPAQNGGVRPDPRNGGARQNPQNGGAYYTANPYGGQGGGNRRPPVKKSNSIAKSIIGMLILALICVGVVWGIMYISGYRYGKIVLEDGVSTVKFFGKIDKEGVPSKGKIYYSDGVVAEIDLENNIVKYSNGDVYEGKLLNYLRNGEGIMRFKSGDVYEGSFINDRISGQGTITYANGDKYIGSFKDGKKDGEGSYIWADGATYTGGFSGDKKNGEGKYIWTDGSWYEGGYYYDMKSGTGTFHFANGDEYVGDFKDDCRTGNGIYKWVNGDEYTGQFVNNQMQGHGVYKWSNGKMYEGNFENGRITNIEVSEDETETGVE